MQCWYLFIFMLFREKGIYDLESCIRVTSNFLVFCNLLKKTKNYIILAWLPNQKSVSLRKRCAAAIITLTQMHTTIFVRFLKWAKITGHLSCLLGFFYWTIAYFLPKVVQMFLNLSLLTSYLTTFCKELHILFLICRICLFRAYCTIDYWKFMLYQSSF